MLNGEAFSASRQPRGKRVEGAGVFSPREPPLPPWRPPCGLPAGLAAFQGASGAPSHPGQALWVTRGGELCLGAA